MPLPGQIEAWLRPSVVKRITSAEVMKYSKSPKTTLKITVLLSGRAACMRGSSKGGG